MKRFCLVLFAGALCGQDIRNTYTPNTDTVFTPREYKTLEEWEARKKELRLQILAAAGLLPMPDRTPLNARIYGRIEHPDYTIEKVLLETMPGFWLGGNLYRPRMKRRSLPAIAMPHGHWTYGRLEHQELASISARAINFARQGYIVFAYDMVGWNDTVQTPHAFGATPEQQLWSFGPLGLQLWNSIRVLDFLETFPDVDRKRIGMTGASGGGTQTFLAYAVDERVKFAAPVNMISSIMQGGSPCENAPLLRVGTNNMEIGAMMAPRPMIMIAATGDWTRNTPRVEFPAVRAIYELYGKAENLETTQIDAEHNYNKASREAVYRFFGKHALGSTDEKAFAERSIRLEKLQDMLALHGQQMPLGALSFEGVFRQWKAIARKKFDETRDVELLRQRLRVVIGAGWPEKVVEAEGVLSTGKGDRVPAMRMEGSGTPVLAVHPDGAEAAKKTWPAGRPGLAIDAFQTGSAVAPRDRSHKFFLTFNRSDDAARVQDILTAVRHLNAQNVELVCTGKAAVWCTFAAALAPVRVKLANRVGPFRGTDEDFARDFFVPGIQRVGGLDAATRVLKAK